ncbi:MAG: class I SAM-dependent methyltransferase [Nocardioidaceae bacterium]
MSDEQRRVDADLSGVPETLLWNLYHRAVAARTPAVLDDPRAVALVDRIDYPFDRLDTPHVEWAARWHALRVRTVDDEIRRFLARQPGATVVALGEGLETTFWRVDNGSVRWLTVELTETVRLRGALLPDGGRRRTVTCSATDPGWIEHVDPGEGVLVTAQGLLMYLQPAEVDALVERCAAAFPGGALLFDAIPPAMLAARAGWQDPTSLAQSAPWVWGLDPATRRRIFGLPGVLDLREVRRARGPGVALGVVLPLLRALPVLGDRLPEFPVLRAQF